MPERGSDSVSSCDCVKEADFTLIEQKPRLVKKEEEEEEPQLLPVEVQAVEG